MYKERRDAYPAGRAYEITTSDLITNPKPVALVRQAYFVVDELLPIFVGENVR